MIYQNKGVSLLTYIFWWRVLDSLVGVGPYLHKLHEKWDDYCRVGKMDRASVYSGI